MEQVEFVGAPVQVRATAELKVPIEPTVMVDMPVEPLGTGSVDGEADIVKSGGTATTAPVRATVCGLEASPSVSVSVPVSETAVGVKIMLTVQVARAGIEVPHPLVTAKSVAAAGGVGAVIVALVNGMAELVLLVSVTVWEAVGVPMAGDVKDKVLTESDRVVPVRFSWATKASEVPAKEGWRTPEVDGRLVEKVTPAT